MSLDSPQNSPPSPRDELEARLTALLLGELSAEEEKALRAALAQDAALAQLHDRLARTIGLVREAAGSLDEEAAPPAEALKLSDGRRETLLQSFKVIRPKQLRKRRVVNWREWAAVAAMIVALLTVAGLMMFNVDSGREAHWRLFSISGSGASSLTERDGRRSVRFAMSEAKAPAVSDAEASVDDAVAVVMTPVPPPVLMPVPVPVQIEAKMVEINQSPSLNAWVDGLAANNPAGTANRALGTTPAKPEIRFDAPQAQITAQLWAEKEGAKASGAEGETFIVKNKNTWESAQPDPSISRRASQIALPTSGDDSPPQVMTKGLEKVLAQNTANDFFDTPAQQAQGLGVQSTFSDLNRSGDLGWGVHGGGDAGGRPEDQITGNSIGGGVGSVTAGVSESRRGGSGGGMGGAGGAGNRSSFAQRLNSVVIRAASGSGVEPKPGIQPASPPAGNDAWFGNITSAQDKNGGELGRPLLRGDAGVSVNYMLSATAAVPPVLAPATPPPARPASGPVTAEGMADRISTLEDDFTTDGAVRDANVSVIYRALTPVAAAKPQAPAEPEVMRKRVDSLGDGITTYSAGAGQGQAANYGFTIMATNAAIAAHGFDSSSFSLKNEILPGLAQVPTSGSYFRSKLSGNGELNAPLNVFKKESKAREKGLLDADGASTVLSYFEGKPASILSGDRNVIGGNRAQLETTVEDPATGLPVEAMLVEKQDAKALRDLQELGEVSARTKLTDEKLAAESSGSGKKSYAIALPQAQQADPADRPLRLGNINANGPVVIDEAMYQRDGELPKVEKEHEIVALNGIDGRGRVTVAKREAEVDSPEKRELVTLLAVRDRLQQRVWQDKIEQAMPREAIVEIIDKAEAGPVKKPTTWGRISGLFDSGVERTARIAVEKDGKDAEAINGPQTASGFDPFWTQTQVEKLQSKLVLEKTIEKLNLNEAWAGKNGGEKLKTEETMKLLKQRLDVRSDPKTSLLEIRAKSDDAGEAARIANTIAEVYRESRLDRWKQLSDVGLEALGKEMVEQNKKIAEATEKLDRQKKQSGREQTDVPLPKLAAGAPVPQPEVSVADNAFSTFSLNVSDVSFKLAAAALEKGQMPDPATVRSEEFINAFDYRDPEPKGSAPVAFAWERARYPFAHNRDLLRFSIKTAASGRQPGRPLNLVLLLDNSGSMERADRVRIIQECLRVLASQLQPQDRVSVVAFARTPRLWVDGLPGSQAGELGQRVGGLTPQGGTNLEEAMNLAYQTASRHFLANGVNRVVLLTDGAANLGDVDPASLKKKVEAQRQQGIALDCFGIGWEGFNDELLESLSRNGDGRYGFVNSPEAAATEFAGQLAGALQVAASDVKVQVEFNPRRVTSYRQIGYAKHQLKKEQFRDNTVDAAEIAAAEAGNALYTVEVNPAGEGPLATVRVRFKIPGTTDYREHEWAVPYEGAAKALEQSTATLRLAGTASAFSEWLVTSPFAGEVTPDRLLSLLGSVPEAFAADPRPKKLEWMLRQAKSVAGR